MRSSVSSTDQPIIVPRRRIIPMMLAWAMTALVFIAVWCACSSSQAGKSHMGIPVRWIGYIGLVVFPPLALYAWLQAMAYRPMLRIERDGLIFPGIFFGQRFVAWNDITHITHANERDPQTGIPTGSKIVFHLHPDSEWMRPGRMLARLDRSVHRYVHQANSPFILESVYTGMKLKELHKLLAKHHQKWQRTSPVRAAGAEQPADAHGE